MKGNLTIILQNYLCVYLSIQQSYFQESTLNIHLQQYENIYTHGCPLQHCFWLQNTGNNLNADIQKAGQVNYVISTQRILCSCKEQHFYELICNDIENILYLNEQSSKTYSSLPFVYERMGKENMRVYTYFCKRKKRGINQKLTALVTYRYQELGWELGEMNWSHDISEYIFHF